MNICVFEDVVVSLGPLALSRPTFALLCGAESLLDRQRRALHGQHWATLVRPEMVDLCHRLYPELPANDRAWLASAASDGLVLVNARWLAPRNVERPTAPEVGLVGDQVAYVALPAGARPLPDAESANLSWWLNDWKQTLPTRQVGGVLIEHPWQLVEQNGTALEDDWHWFRYRDSAGVPAGVSLVGPSERLVIDRSAKVEAMTFLDTTKGPILIDAGATVQAFSRLTGPCYVGPGTHVLAARVSGSSFGPHCRIGGEVEASIVQGYTNKAHEGFLGHSFLGEWVNLGAGTITSDLRNDYGNITLTVAGRRVASGLIKVGSFIGDHTKVCIGSMLNTGSVIGPFCQLVTPGVLLPRSLPAFCTVNGGRILDRTDLGGMFETAAIAMGRRGREWTEDHAEFFLGVYEITAHERQQAVRDSETRRQRKTMA
jgi:UDP-N-acetylglucosamine diphosphorylase / glucose-1-phosphate thymidylyltransferase / UDP-N-acetylgalactosamine diphosphorylase / glucosamine-1-phosphate N-acetyltransferase / galactosamine-1-phosphate N-acetyltransferase